jgi:hypothetical protein
MFGFDPHVLVEVTKPFANHLNVPKKGFKVYVEPLKKSSYITKVEKQVKQASSFIIEEYVETPPYPRRVKENLLTTIANKSARRFHEPYEQIDMKHQILAIKELNEEITCDVYLCEDSTKVIQKVIPLKLVNLSYPVLLELNAIMVFVILKQV